MKPKVMVIEKKQAESWKEEAVASMSFMEAEELVHELKDGLFDLSNLSSQTGLEFFIILRK
jgi:hypothetical protein